MTVALCMFALWAWGGWISWKGIENRVDPYFCHAHGGRLAF